MAGWLIISSEQNFDITSSLDFTKQGLKKRHRKKALQIEPGDILFFYITGIQRLGGMVRIESFVNEADDKVWVNLGKNPDECYPWHFDITPLIILLSKTRDGSISNVGRSPASSGKIGICKPSKFSKKLDL